MVGCHAHGSAWAWKLGISMATRSSGHGTLRRRQHATNSILPRMSSIPHIALLIETSREYARGLLRGVARYHHEHGPWSIYLVPHGLDEPPPAWLRHWKGDGILCRINNRRMLDAIIATRIPAVDVRGALHDVPVPFVGLDNRPIAQLGYEHLLQCGLKNFAFCGRPRGENPPQDERCDYFVEFVKAGGYCAQVFPGPDVDVAKCSWEQE